MSITLSKSFGFRERVEDSGPDTELHDVDCQNEVIKMNWIGKKGHDKDIGSWDWTNHHVSFSTTDALAHQHKFSHDIHLYADSHGKPEFPTDHVHKHTSLKIDLNKQDLEDKLRKCDNNMYFQSFYKIGIHWGKHHMDMQVKNPKTGDVMASKEHIPYDHE